VGKGEERISRIKGPAESPKALARKKPKGGRLSLHGISAELAARGVLNELYAMHGACSFREHELQPRVQASKAQRMRDL
jgi:hypothetical protein